MSFRINICWSTIYTWNIVSSLQNIIIVLSRHCKWIHQLWILDYQSLRVCLMQELALCVPLDQFSSLSLSLSLSLIYIFSLQCYFYPLSSIPTSYHQYWIPFLKNKEDTMQSIRHEIRWTLEYKINIKDLYDI